MKWSRREWVRNSTAAALGTALEARGRQQQTHAFVRASGKHLLTPGGERLLLRGINLGNWFEPEGYMFLFEGGPQSPREIEAFFNELIGPSGAAEFWKEYRRRYITEKDIEFIRRSGMNSIRIPLHYKFFQPGGGGFELLDPVIARAGRPASGSFLICTVLQEDRPERTLTIVGAIHGSMKAIATRS